jgi:hypothetical protein
MKKLIAKKEAFASSWTDAKAMLKGSIGRYYASPSHRVTLRRTSGGKDERGTWVVRVWEVTA